MGDSFLVVSCYTRFDNLAHGPKGTEAKQALHTFHLDANDGQLTKLSVTTEDIMNPAFSRFHKSRNILYTCTESVLENGRIHTWEVCEDGKLNLVGDADAGGTSTCYLTLDRQCKNLLAVNYWDSTIPVLEIDSKSFACGKILEIFDPKQGKEMVASGKKHVNHSINDESAQKERQADPHSHAVVLDPLFGKVAFVPDLGMDLIRQFLYDGQKLTPAGTTKSGPEGRTCLGPRYIDFHPTLPVAYVVNELASEISVFKFSIEVAEELVRGGEQQAWRSGECLRLLQTVRTVPSAFPGRLNTCGRIAVHPSGWYVLVSNRGHDSIVVFQVDSDNGGRLDPVHVQQTRGSTPRHFQFDPSGQWLIAANQDSDEIAVFQFNLATGRLAWTPQRHSVPSPNFVCCMRLHKPRKIRPPIAFAKL